MSTVVPILRSRVDPAPLTALVALVDLALVGAFVLLGEFSHGAKPFANPVWVAETYAQFLVGWTVAAFVGGLYTRDAWHSPKRALSWTLPAWLVAAAIAQGVRATPLVHGNAAVTLYLVSAVVGGTLLCVWRVTLAALSSA